METDSERPAEPPGERVTWTTSQPAGWEGDHGWSAGPPVWAAAAAPVPAHSRRHIALAVTLFLLTVGSTYLGQGPAYSAAIMTILLCHEMGHYLMCRRYRVRSTLPLFIPMPFI